MEKAEAENFVRELFYDIWEGHNVDKFASFYHPNVEAYASGKTINYEEIKLHALTMQREWKDTKIVFKDIISADNKIAVRYIMSGIKAEMPVSFEMMGIYDLKDNMLYRIFGLSNPPMSYPKNTV